jgi:hypothetical protein
MTSIMLVGWQNFGRVVASHGLRASCMPDAICRMISLLIKLEV